MIGVNDGDICGRCGRLYLNADGSMHECRLQITTIANSGCSECGDPIVDTNGLCYMCSVEPDIKRYSLGFLFDSEMSNVVMIEKTKPDWQSGLINGVGGKVENVESYHDCMVREFKEETDVDICSWKRVGTLNFDRAEIAIFAATHNHIYDAISTTEETVHIIPVWSIYAESSKFIDNVPSLIMLAMKRLALSS